MFALADVVISRAGANAICEINALKKPNLLIPLSANAQPWRPDLKAPFFRTSGLQHGSGRRRDHRRKASGFHPQLYNNRQTYIDAMSGSSHMNSIEKITELIEECAAR